MGAAKVLVFLAEGDCYFPLPCGDEYKSHSNGSVRLDSSFSVSLLIKITVHQKYADLSRANCNGSGPAA